MTAEQFEVELGKKLQKLRETKGKTQAEVAEALGLNSRETVKQWESWDRHIKAGDLIKLSQYYGVSSDYLLGISEVKKPEADTQAACQYTGLSEDAIDLIRHFEMISHTLNALSLKSKDQSVSDVPLFKLGAVFINLEKAVLPVIASMRDDSEQRYVDSTMKMEQLEVALSRFERTCRDIPQSIFHTNTVLDEMQKRTNELLAKEFAEFLKKQEEKEEVADGEHTED